MESSYLHYAETDYQEIIANYKEGKTDLTKSCVRSAKEYLQHMINVAENKTSIDRSVNSVTIPELLEYLSDNHNFRFPQELEDNLIQLGEMNSSDNTSFAVDTLTKLRIEFDKFIAGEYSEVAKSNSVKANESASSEAEVTAAFNAVSHPNVGMTFDEFLDNCDSYGGNWGKMLLSGIKRMFPNDYDAVKSHYENMDFSGGGVKPFTYLCEWLASRGVTFSEK